MRTVRRRDQRGPWLVLGHMARQGFSHLGFSSAPEQTQVPRGLLLWAQSLSAHEHLPGFIGHLTTPSKEGKHAQQHIGQRGDRRQLLCPEPWERNSWAAPTGSLCNTEGKHFQGGTGTDPFLCCDDWFCYYSLLNGDYLFVAFGCVGSSLLSAGIF